MAPHTLNKLTPEGTLAESDRGRFARVRELCRQLRPIVGPRADRIWLAFVAEDEDGKKQIHEYLELLAAQHFLGNLQSDGPGLIPPNAADAKGIAYCLALARLVESLERAGCTHRDISGGNLFIDPATDGVSLIDFDSLFHRDLAMPARTTCGTAGYIPAFMGAVDAGDPRGTWCVGGDRFAVSILSVEFLLMKPASPEQEDGSLFPQSELSARSGSAVQDARRELMSEWPNAVKLFDRALAATSSLDCPGPEEWRQLCLAWNRPPVSLPSMPTWASIRRIFARKADDVTNPTAALNLSEMPVPKLQKPVRPVTVVPLPANPWKS